MSSSIVSRGRGHTDADTDTHGTFIMCQVCSHSPTGSGASLPFTRWGKKHTNPQWNCRYKTIRRTETQAPRTLTPAHAAHLHARLEAFWGQGRSVRFPLRTVLRGSSVSCEFLAGCRATRPGLTGIRSCPAYKDADLMIFPVKITEQNNCHSNLAQVNRAGINKLRNTLSHYQIQFS